MTDSLSDVPEAIEFALEDRSIFVAGHRGMVGSAILRRLAGEKVEIFTASKAELDLRDQSAVRDFMAQHRPDVVILAAARVGGILANASQPAKFIYDNLAIALNVIHAAYRTDVRKLLFLGSSCIYPRMSPQPIPEDALLTGPLESTNEWYAVAKIAGIKLCQAYRRQYGCDFISCQPTNLYGPNDNFDPETSHVIPGLLRRAHEARISGASSLSVWGSGRARREFLHVDDLADACVHLLRTYSDEVPINIGSGEDQTIAETARLIVRTVGFTGRLDFDSSKPDGTPQKLLDSRRLSRLGWQPKIPLTEGLESYYEWFLNNVAPLKQQPSAAV